MSKFRMTINYALAYTDASFWEKLKRWASTLGKELTEKTLWFYYTAQDPNVPAKAKAIIYGALGYLIMPIDLIPDTLPALGYSDDMSVLLAALAQVALYITPETQEKARQRLHCWFGEENRA